MKYYERVLRPDEKLEFHSTIHWIVYWPAVVFALLALLAIGVKLGLGLQANQGTACVAAAAVLALLALIAWLRAWIRRIATEIAVTNFRVIYRRGLISRNTLEMNMSKIETVDVDQSIWGRMFDYGNVVIRGSGGTFEPLIGIEHPLQLRNTILVG